MSLTRAGKPLVLWIVSPKLRIKLKFGATFILFSAKMTYYVRFNLTKVSIESSSGKIFRK